MKNISLLLALILLTCALGAAQDVPKLEWFLGYNYIRVNSTTKISSYSANGGSSQLAYNFNKYIAAVFDIGGYHNGVVNGYNIDNTMLSYLWGPRVNIRKGRVIPYFNTLFGGIWFGASTATNVAPCTGTNCGTTTPTGRAAGSLNAFAMAIGGGLDIKINKHASFRPIGLDYFLTRLKNPVLQDDHNQHNLRYSAGINFLFGGEKPIPPPPPPPPMRSCWNGTSVPADQACPKREMALRLGTRTTGGVCAGESVTITPAGEFPDNAALAWSINGQPTSQGRSFEFGTTGRDPGSYRIGLAATAPDYNDSSAETTINVLPYRAPAGTLQVSPAEIWAGEKATLSARFDQGQCAGTLRGPELSANEGTVSGDVFDSSAVQFDPSDNSEQRKTIRLQARVADQKGVTAAEASVVVKKKAVLAARRLPDIVFPANSGRVNNCGKRVLLEELKALIDRDPTGTVAFVGHVANKEKSDLDRKRAMNAAAIISAGQGICTSFPASQIQVSGVGATDNGVDAQPHFCGTSAIPKTGELSGQTVKESDANAKFRRVEVWFIPTGGVVPASLKDPQAASALPVSSLGCPK